MINSIKHLLFLNRIVLRFTDNYEICMICGKLGDIVPSAFIASEFPVCRDCETNMHNSVSSAFKNLRETLGIPRSLKKDYPND